MKKPILLAVFCLFAAPAFAQGPGWTMADTQPDTGGRAPVAPGGKVLPPGSSPLSVLAGCSADIDKICQGRSGLYSARACLTENKAKLSPRCVVDLAKLPPSSVPPCSRSPLCDNRLGTTREQLKRVLWNTGKVSYSYPFTLPVGGGATGVGIDTKGNFWVLQRAVPGQPQLFQFGPDYKLVRTVPNSVIGALEKGHTIKVDRDDNVWISDANGGIVLKLSQQGKLLMTLGVRGKRGDWDESKKQRLLWQPLDVAFAPNGDVFIAQGHGNESPNDVGLAPDNMIGAARILHLDKNGKFINQWYGNQIGPGKFGSAHGVGVDPRNGDVWIGDREEYSLVVYGKDGKHKRTIQMRNLMSAVAFDPRGDLWVSSGRDGQLLKLDRNGNVLAAVGNGSGTSTDQFVEATYMAWDKSGAVYSGDTSVGRVTKMVVPK